MKVILFYTLCLLWTISSAAVIPTESTANESAPSQKQVGAPKTASTAAAAVADDRESAVSDVETVEEEEEDEASRIKRQHGGGNPIGGILGGILNKKLGLIGSLSSISSSSKGGKSYDYPAHPAPKPFDWWSFKKTIFASLLQAVKAITGGFIALNGQLVKVKGHLLAAKGGLLANKGDAISNFGRHLATNAFSQPHVSAHEVSIPSAPASSGSGFGNDYTSNLDFPAGPVGYYEGANGYAKRAAVNEQNATPEKAANSPQGFHAGLFLLKPVEDRASQKGPNAQLPTVIRPQSIFERTDDSQKSDKVSTNGSANQAKRLFHSEEELDESERLSIEHRQPYEQ